MTSNFNLLRYTFGPPKHGQQKGKLVEWRMMGVMNGAWVALAVRQPKVKPILDLREQVTTHRTQQRVLSPSGVGLRGSCGAGCCAERGCACVLRSWTGRF